VKDAGGHVVGVIPDFMRERELAYHQADELITVGSMRERKRIMEERAQAFLALPGGIGTLEELTEIMTLRYINRIDKPVVVFNQDGFYDDLLRFFDRMTRERFKSEGLQALFGVADAVGISGPSSRGPARSRRTPSGGSPSRADAPGGSAQASAGPRQAPALAR